MEVIRKIGLLSLLVVATLFVQNASATLAPILPDSSYYDGYVFYEEEVGPGVFLQGRIDFAVYDTEGENGNEFENAGFETPGTGRYIYAYQIFNDYDYFSEEAVAYFAILDIDGALIDEALVNGTSSQDDGEGGIAPAENSPRAWTWKEESDGGYGYILAGEHSSFLVFSSDQDWTEGDYDIRGPGQDNLVVPLPEPSTIAFLGIGGALTTCMRRRKSVQ